MPAPPAPTSEEHLLAAVAAGDQTALARLYDLHAPALTRELAADGVPTPTIGTIVHNLFLQLWVAAPRLDPSAGFTTYARRLLEDAAR